ncbi:MAG: hypothetical protein SOY06_04400 [Prevotella sp.]|nr:hypothetical protein [Bacteroidales bacterium]MDY4229070.1 hypothetical protein [Prevotella sp.]
MILEPSSLKADTGSKVIIIGDEVTTLYSDEVERTGLMSEVEAKRLSRERKEKEELLKRRGGALGGVQGVGFGLPSRSGWDSNSPPDRNRSRRRCLHVCRQRLRLLRLGRPARRRSRGERQQLLPLACSERNLTRTKRKMFSS